jgi:hypothetical protein
MATGVEATSSTLEAVSAQIAAYVKTSLGADPAQSEAITIGGSPGRLMTFYYTIAGLAPVQMLEAVCVRNGRAYEISYANLRGTESADRALFLGVLASFTFTSAAG